MYTNLQKWHKRSGITIEVKETQGAVHDWILYQYTNQQYANKLAQEAYQLLIQQLQGQAFLKKDSFKD